MPSFNPTSSCYAPPATNPPAVRHPSKDCLFYRSLDDPSLTLCLPSNSPFVRAETIPTWTASIPELENLVIDITHGFKHLAECITNWRFDIRRPGLDLEERHCRPQGEGIRGSPYQRRVSPERGTPRLRSAVTSQADCTAHPRRPPRSTGCNRRAGSLMRLFHKRAQRFQTCFDRGFWIRRNRSAHGLRPALQKPHPALWIHALYPAELSPLYGCPW